MDDFDLYLDAYPTIYSYRLTKILLHIVKDWPKDQGRSSIINNNNNNNNNENVLLFFKKQLRWEWKLHFQDCILHVPSYLIALKSFWSTANCCESNKLLSIYNKILGKEVLRAWIAFKAALLLILWCGELSRPTHTVRFPKFIYFVESSA